MAKGKWIQMISIIVLLGSSCTKMRSEGEQEAAVDFCSLKSQNVDDVATVVINEAQQIRAAMRKADDNCLLDVISNLSKTPSVENFQALEVIASNGDGYVGEALIDETVRLLENDPAMFIDYLRSNPGAYLSRYLIEGLSMKCSTENVTPVELESRFNSKLENDLEKETLNEIFQNVDPEMFD